VAYESEQDELSGSEPTSLDATKSTFTAYLGADYTQVQLLV